MSDEIIKKGTINAHLILSSTNARSRVHHNARPNRGIDLFYQLDGSKFRLYDKNKDPQPIYKEAIENVDGDKRSEEEDEEQIESKEFAYEKDLFEGKVLSNILKLNGIESEYYYIRTKQELEEIADMFSENDSAMKRIEIKKVLKNITELFGVSINYYSKSRSKRIRKVSYKPKIP